MSMKVKASMFKGFKYQIKDTNPVRDLERGVYQFCLDHGRITPDYIKVSFLFKDKAELLRRIWARGTYLYSIKDEAKIKKELEKNAILISRLKTADKKAKRRESAINKLPKWKKWLIIKLRQITNTLIDKWIA